MIGRFRLAISYSIAKQLPLIIDKTSFARDLKTSQFAPVLFQCHGLEGCSIQSPFFPYQQLDRVDVQHGSACSGRSLKIDSVLNVFWVQVDKDCYSTQFFGPFRMNQ